MSWSPPKVFDEYRIERALGEGHMGRVYLAEDSILDRSVAIKFLRPERLSPTTREQFFIGARAGARVQHQNVASIYRAGVISSLSSEASITGLPFLVSEFVPGRSMEEFDVPIPVFEAVTLVVNLVRGLAEAHKQGVLHCDIKPGNILVTPHGIPKLVDFGFARLAPVRASRQKALRQRFEWNDEVTSDLEATAELDLKNVLAKAKAIVGTPDYMAPELWFGAPATPRSDIYAVGGVFFRLIEGCTPFAHVEARDLPTAIQRTAPPRVKRGPPFVGEIIDRCLARTPSYRWQSTSELIEALEKLAHAGLG